MSTSSTPDVPREDTLATEVFTEAPASPVATATSEDPTQPASAAPALPEPTYLSGPAPFAVVLGLLGLLFAAATLFAQLTDLSLPWTNLGPWTVVAVGLVVVLVGAIGLRGSRTRD
jgi:protein-S-isoprenylcysteine O-methyltransferase Ste14